MMRSQKYKSARREVSTVNKYQVVVGNIGTVYSGNSLSLAKNHFEEYVKQSEGGYGRAANEDVTLFRSDEIIDEHFGKNVR